MQKRETLPQLIRRTVFEFEQRQAARLLIDNHLEDELSCSHPPTAKTVLSKNKKEKVRSQKP